MDTGYVAVAISRHSTTEPHSSSIVLLMYKILRPTPEHPSQKGFHPTTDAPHLLLLLLPYRRFHQALMIPDEGLPLVTVTTIPLLTSQA